MDRRTFMLTGAWLSTMAGGAWPWLAQAAARGNEARTLAVADSTLVCGSSFARYAAHLKLPIFETGDDAGALWFSALAPLLGDTSARAAPSLIGFTRASDYFILRHLAMRTGRFIEESHEQRAGPHAQPAHVAFALTPRIARIA
ncbi:hypothetical protein [Paraburkholderia susongensis]|uniref:Uncharacterized protein n=1 Tax=Paraburkholderia susongensis TaxID=1515439 RepID=A0A1X7JIA5_9BURK|nr:hypothetical protein [Paraburkholderia susongensis]SMG26988.1 hypothetical protein SAMN06265784_102601 [Paraburkholderia susongensis]